MSGLSLDGTGLTLTNSGESLTPGVTPLIGGTVGRVMYHGAGNVLAEALVSWAAGTLTLGGPDAAAPVAQTIAVQSVVAGTADTAGAQTNYDASKSTGIGLAGVHLFWISSSTATPGSAVNALTPALGLESWNNGITSDPTNDTIVVGANMAAYGLGFLFGGYTPSGTLGADTAIASASNNILIWNAAAGTAIGSTADRTLTLYPASRIPAASLTFPSTNQLNLGLPDAAAPTAQTFGTQSVVAGTTNTAGANLTLTGSQGTGTGIGGDFGIQVAPAGSTGSAQNALVDALRLKANGSVILNHAAIATNATDGFLYIATCAGTPTGTPTAVSGRVAIIFDTTNHQFWVYDGGWKQPKTPAAAALITWQ